MEWIVSQLGSREHYSIPRALSQAGKSVHLITDMWFEPNHLVHKMIPASHSRFHPDLKNNLIKHFNRLFLINNILQRSVNYAFNVDNLYDQAVDRYASKQFNNGKKIFFTYSYSNQKTIKRIKDQGHWILLGQINPGPFEAEIVNGEYHRLYGKKYKPFVPDEKYWENWWHEVGHSDRMLVNSSWSKELLVKAGVAEEKIRIIPLAYERQEMLSSKTYPDNFSKKRPLKLLFLGGLEIRKGVHYLIDAMRKLQNEPCQLDLVGILKSPQELLNNLPDNIVYHGPVSPAETDNFYRNADLFVLPTLSDGFAITQLEAQSYKLPLIVSRFCGDVIKNRYNGVVLDEISADNLANCIREIIENPENIMAYSSNSALSEKFSLTNLSKSLLEIEDEFN